MLATGNYNFRKFRLTYYPCHRHGLCDKMMWERCRFSSAVRFFKCGLWHPVELPFLIFVLNCVLKNYSHVETWIVKHACDYVWTFPEIRNIVPLDGLCWVMLPLCSHQSWDQKWSCVLSLKMTRVSLTRGWRLLFQYELNLENGAFFCQPLEYSFMGFCKFPM